MRYRTIAGTDISVSEVGFGVWTVAAGWWGDYSDDEAVTLLRQGYEHGINFFDTADTYGKRPRRDDPRAGLPRRRA